MGTVSRVPVQVLSGDGSDALAGLEADFTMLDAGIAAARAWTCRSVAVVLGVSRDLHAEVDTDACRTRGAAILRRSSGGGTVVIGPGTLQWALVIPHDEGMEPPSLDAAKGSANAAVRRALAAAGAGIALDDDPWGDLCAGDRKVGGLAIRRQRAATLVHGTLLTTADIANIAALLKHPQREPAWRRGRPHGDFLARLGAVDPLLFSAALVEAAHGAR